MPSLPGINRPRHSAVFLAKRRLSICFGVLRKSFCSFLWAYGRALLGLYGVLRMALRERCCPRWREVLRAGDGDELVTPLFGPFPVAVTPVSKYKLHLFGKTEFFVERRGP